MRPRQSEQRTHEKKEYEDRVLEIQRVSRVVKGGRRIRFRALVIVGNHNGKIGVGVAKANEVTEAVRKASEKAKKRFITVPIINGTIPHEITVKHGGAKVMLRPATQGTSIVAGGSVRTVAELAGLTDLLAKSMGSSNKINNVLATLKAFQSFSPAITQRVKRYSEKAIEANPVNVKSENIVAETLPAEKQDLTPSISVDPKPVEKEDTTPVKEEVKKTTTKKPAPKKK